MFANSLETFAATLKSPNQGLSEAPLKHPVVHPDRRMRVRTTVHWPVVFFRPGSGEAIESVTQNLSSSGFYCHSRELIAPGESLICTIKFPSYDPSGYERTRVLQCRVQIKRVESSETGDFYGIACHIQDYRLVIGDDDSPIVAA